MTEKMNPWGTDVPEAGKIPAFLREPSVASEAFWALKVRLSGVCLNAIMLEPAEFDDPELEIPLYLGDRSSDN